MAKPIYREHEPYFSTLTNRYYPTYDAAWHDSLRSGGGTDTDFNLFLVHADGSTEFVY
ncbi:MAG TPA: hypothetical protein VGJ33_00500 [Candidatus Angelobacter sp.]|jgi:hypothetical protein